MLATEFLDALLPLSRQLRAQRTLSDGKVGILRHLEEQGPASVSDLAAVINVSNQGASLGVRDLEALGHVTRATDEADRRRVWIAITDTGRAALTRESTASRVLLQSVVERTLSPDERTTLIAAIPVLTKLARGLRDE